MKIGYFVSEYPYRNHFTGEVTSKLQKWGGVENGTYNLVTQMAKRGHEVFVFTTSINSKDSVETYHNIKIFRFKQNLIIGQAPISFGLIYKPLFSGIDLDIIHARMGNLPAPLTAYLYSKKNNKKLIVSYHGDWVGGFGGIKRRLGVFLFNKFICNTILNESDQIIALSKEHVIESKHLDKFYSKLSYIPNGINFEDFSIPLSKKECRIKLGLPIDSKIILFVGSLIWRKAPDVLLKAMELVISEIPCALLIFIGDGRFRDELTDMAKELGIMESIQFCGYVSDQFQKILYYKAADVFVLPSREGEAYPNVLLEASACSLPLIVSRCECFKAIVEDGYNGSITTTDDEIDLSNKIINILQNKKTRERMGINAEKKIRTMSWDRIAEITCDLYENAVLFRK